MLRVPHGVADVLGQLLLLGEGAPLDDARGVAKEDAV